MAPAIVEVTSQIKQNDVPRDFITNTIHASWHGSGTPGNADWQALTDAIKHAFYVGTAYNSATFTNYQKCGGRVVAYDMSDAKPRPEKAVSLYTPATWNSTLGAPRLLSLCLSFYGARNLPRTRGRIYCGVLFDAGEKPQTADMNAIISLGHELNQLLVTTSNWSHCTYSTVDHTTQDVQNYWVNDVFDVQRKRNQKESNRVRYP